MNRLFRWGTLIALFILMASAYIAYLMIFSEGDGMDVPSVVGMASTEASSVLTQNGLFARIDMVESDQPEGTVVSQVPSLGAKVVKGTAIVIKVSKGGALANVPDVRGMDFADAARELSAAGFKIGSVLRVNDSLKSSGTVIAQNPSSPAMIPNDRMIELLVSEGTPGKNEMVQIPDLRGQNESLAREILKQSDLSVSRVITVDSNLVPNATVLRTQPIAGSRVPNGNAIVIYIAKNFEETSGTTAPQISETPPNHSAVQQPPAVPQSVQPGLTPQTGVNPSSVTPAGTTQPAVPAAPQTQPAAQQVSRPDTQSAQPPAPAMTPSKTAKIRYNVPPLTREMRLRITITDDRGMRVIKDQRVRGNEFISANIGFTGTANVVVMMDEAVVWQERYK